MGQNGKFCEMEYPISLTDEDDDFIPIFLLQTQSPTRGAFTPQQCGTQTGTALGLLPRSSSLLSLPQAEGGTQSHDQQGKMDMHDHGGLGSLGKAAQVPGILAFLENAILNHRAAVIAIKDDKRVADGAIGQVDRPVRGGHAIIEASHDHSVDGLALVIAPMGVTLVCWGSP